MKAHRSEVIMKDDTRLALLEQSIIHINETMIRIEKRFDSIDYKFERVDKRFEQLENRIDNLATEMKQGFKDLNNRLWTNFFWMTGGFSGVMGFIAHALHWI